MTPHDVAAELRARESRFHEAVAAEVARARAKFPGNRHQYVALAEEVGEVAKALIEGESPEAIYAECVQVAAMAQRVAEDGDDDFPEYEPAALDEAASLVESSQEARVEPTADEREAIRRAAKLIDADFAPEVVRALNGYLSREPASTRVREEARVDLSPVSNLDNLVAHILDCPADSEKWSDRLVYLAECVRFDGPGRTRASHPELMKFAASHPADERIELDDLGDTDATE